MISLTDAAAEINKRLVSLFLKNDNNERPVHGRHNWFYQLPVNQDLCLFYEYINGDTSAGVGASHQTGWTALIVNLIAPVP